MKTLPLNSMKKTLMTFKIKISYLKSNAKVMIFLEIKILIFPNQYTVVNNGELYP